MVNKYDEEQLFVEQLVKEIDQLSDEIKKIHENLEREPSPERLKCHLEDIKSSLMGEHQYVLTSPVNTNIKKDDEKLKNQKLRADILKNFGIEKYGK